MKINTKNTKSKITCQAKSIAFNQKTELFTSRNFNLGIRKITSKISSDSNSLSQLIITTE